VLGNFYLHRLGSTNPTLMMERRHLGSIGLRLGKWLVYGRMALSASGTKLALAAGSTKGAVGSLHIYAVDSKSPIQLDKPNYSFETQEVITSIAWGPGENALAVMGIGRTVSVRVLEIKTGRWNLLSHVPIQRRVPDIDVLAMKTLSWVH
jgi:hypothetical protein